MVDGDSTGRFATILENGGPESSCCFVRIDGASPGSGDWCYETIFAFVKAVHTHPLSTLPPVTIREALEEPGGFAHVEMMQLLGLFDD